MTSPLDLTWARWRHSGTLATVVGSFSPRAAHGTTRTGLAIVVALFVATRICAASISDEDKAYARIRKLGEECRAGKPKSCAKLAEIAGDHSDRAVSAAAVRNPGLTDQTVLVGIARRHSSWAMRQAAVKKLSDQAVLAEIAKTPTDWRVRVAAVENLKLTDQALLAQIAGTNSCRYSDLAHCDRRLAEKVAVDKLTDQALLGDVAKSGSPHMMVRLAAVEKLADQTILAEIAKLQPERMSENTLHVSQAALKKLTDQALLANVARNAGSPRVREAAVVAMGAFGSVNTVGYELTDKTEFPQGHDLAHFADQACRARLGTGTIAPQLARFGKRVVAIGDQPDLRLRIDLAGEPIGARYTAPIGARSTDQWIASAGARATACVSLQNYAVEYRSMTTISPPSSITGGRPYLVCDSVEQALENALLKMVLSLAQDVDQALLAHIVRTEKDAGLLFLAANKLSDQTLLADLARKDCKGANPNWCEAAIENPNLTDQALLAEIAKTPERYNSDRYTAEEVGRAAARRLTDQVLLSDIAMTANHSSVRHTAIEKLTDQALLARIAKTYSRERDEQVAVRRLTDEAILYDVAMAAKNEEVCIMAVIKLTDPALVNAARLHWSERWRVRQAASQRIAEIATTASDPNLRLAALPFSDVDTLVDVETIDPVDAVREAARARRIQLHGRGR